MLFLNYNRIDYLSNCDLISKYLIKSINKIPRIKTINLKFLLNQNLTLFEGGNITFEYFFLKCFLCMYFIFQKLPFITYGKYLNSIKVISNTFYNLKISAKNHILITFYLLLLFRDIDKKDNFLSQLNYDTTQILFSTLIINKKFDLLLNSYTEYSTLLTSILDDKEFIFSKIHVNFFFENVKSSFISNIELKNILLF